jgi:hypothetical protein
MLISRVRVGDRFRLVNEQGKDILGGTLDTAEDAQRIIYAIEFAYNKGRNEVKDKVMSNFLKMLQ